jgi:oligopeptide/dipeptide ABC transporter ATP-binding protein
MSAPTLLQASGLSKTFKVGQQSLLRRGVRPSFKAVDDVSLSLAPHETLGVVGESGCGKSTLARLLVRVVEPDGGRVQFREDEVLTLSAAELRAYRGKVQMVFQSPYTSLNPRLKVGESILLNLMAQGVRRGAEATARVNEMLTLVGLSPSYYGRYPHQLSGGQRQRVGIARALVSQPDVVIADEAVSALDKSVQAQILNLLKEIQQRLGVAYLFISHDLNVIRYMSGRVLVMYLGKAVETGPVQEVYSHPLHPYTLALLKAVPNLEPASFGKLPSALPGEMPSPLALPTGCRFRTRCPLATDLCGQSDPALEEVAPGRFVACHNWEVMASGTAPV